MTRRAKEPSRLQTSPRLWSARTTTNLRWSAAAFGCCREGPPSSRKSGRDHRRHCEPLDHPAALAGCGERLGSPSELGRDEFIDDRTYETQHQVHQDKADGDVDGHTLEHGFPPARGAHWFKKWVRS